MNSFRMLVGLYLRDLMRRRILWGLVIVGIVALAITHYTSRAMEEAVGRGESISIATRQAASRLDNLAMQVRPWIYVIVVLLAAQVAPESRRNGTTQFVLSFGVRRDKLAAAQFCALAVVVTVGIAILHAGFAVAGSQTHSFSAPEIGFAWLGLLLPLLASAACAFSFSLTASAISTYLVFLGVPFLSHTLPDLMRSMPKGMPLVLVRSVENLALLVPTFDEWTLWPHLVVGQAHTLPSPEWRWGTMHMLLAIAFWGYVGVSLHRRYDIGSRTALK